MKSQNTIENPHVGAAAALPDMPAFSKLSAQDRSPAADGTLMRKACQ
jgi:hypothetical protein